MSVKLAETAGFCMGVKRAVDMVLALARRKGRETIYTYGPLIHNPQTVELLKRRGIVPVAAIEEIPADADGAGIIIRAHGISPQERRLLKEKKLRIFDATCPKVGRVQAIIKKYAARDFTILIIGDAGHPEVSGLMGYASGKGLLIAAPEDIPQLPVLDKVCVVAQTTQSVAEYAGIVAAIRERYPEAVVFDTICDSTEKRQNEIKSLAEEMDAVIIVGGRNSANTRRLAALAELQGTPTFHVETAAELDIEHLAPYDKIGISAGASTPNWIIDRVVDKITDQQAAKNAAGKYVFKLWFWLVRTDLYSALGAGCLAAAAMLLQEMALHPVYVLFAAMYVYAMHTLNRFINRQTGSIISSFREESYRRHEKKYLSTAVLFLAFVLAVALFSRPAAFIFLLAMSVMGILYNARLAPSGWLFRSIRDLPASKNFSVSLAWAAVTVLLPPVGENLPLTAATAVSFTFIFGMVFIHSLLSDVLDIQGDKLIGKETIPVLIGRENTHRLLHVLLLFLVILLTLAPSLGVTVSLSYFEIIPVIYIWICFRIYDSRPTLMALVKEGVLETVYIVAGLSAGLWLLIVRGYGA
ncbi:MAG TPA: 4-hydroxy-3-methylbut-2-enyl diphosphate reductase [Syntrophales bacterium]|nr:4-hydroxy-3-methylbut-2-enyl diphosphate reductase [Syntrophales bacterium]